MRVAGRRRSPTSGQEWALAFWQQEKDHYAARARVSGTKATGPLTVSLLVFLAAAAPVVGVPDAHPLGAFVVPFGILLLWAYAIRNLEEMHRLGAYGDHADSMIATLTKRKTTVSGYRTWKEAGGTRQNESRSLAQVTWMSLAFLLSAGTSACLIASVVQANPGDWKVVALAVLHFAVVVLVFIGYFAGRRRTKEVVGRLQETF